MKKIKCLVNTCKYNTEQLCQLDCIEICNCGSDCEKKDTMCNSYKLN